MHITDASSDWAARPVRWQQRAQLPAPYRQACDVASHPEGLFIAASVDALGTNGAAIFRLRDGQLTQTMDWEGQSFLRVHNYGATLVVPDVDAPFSALSFAVDWDVAGFIFISSPTGQMDSNHPKVLPAAYHVFDTALVDDTLVASTGSYHPDDVAYFSKHAPATLMVDDGPGRPWRRTIEYPSATATGVNRFTYLHALGDGAMRTAVQTSRRDLPTAVRIAKPTGGSGIEKVEGLQGQVLRWSSWKKAGMGEMRHMFLFEISTAHLLS